METLTATFKIVTPMFLGDAQQNAVDIRPPSVKGVLRFWWRAMMWGKVLQEENNNSVQALKKLHQQEAELFGSAAGEKTGGQSAFFLQVRPHKGVSTLSADEMQKEYPLKKYNGIKYLLGQGLNVYNKAKKDNDYTRGALVDGSFDVIILFRPQKDESILEKHKKQITQSLLLLGTLGGLGSRSRRGMGSVAIHKLSGTPYYQAPKNQSEFKALLKNLLNEFTDNSLPPFTAFSKKVRIDISCKDENILPSVNKGRLNKGLVDKVGKIMNDYRRFTKQSTKFQSDHEKMRKVACQAKSIEGHPERLIFGLPHNYFFPSCNGNGVEIDIVHRVPDSEKWTSEERNRRASPLFIHFHQFPDQKEYIAIQAVIPATFLPSDHFLQFTQVKEDENKNKIKIPVNPNHPNEVEITLNLWERITDYMDSFMEKEKII